MNRQELIEAIDGLEVFDMSYYNGDMKHLPRKNFYINKYQALSLIDKLDDIPEGYEVLSPDWVDEHKCIDESIMLLTEPPKYVEFIKVSDLQNLLIPKQSAEVRQDSKSAEKVKIPQFVAEWVEQQRESADFDEEYHESYEQAEREALGDSVHFAIWHLFSDIPHTNPDVEQRIPVLDWLDDDRNNYFKLVDAVRYGYEVEPEKKYTVTLANGKQLCRIDDDVIDFNGQCCDEKFADNYNLTQAEIESVDPTLMRIAVEVE